MIKDAVNEELLACPFCSSNNVDLRNGAAGNWVACISCGLEAPSETGVTADQAIKYWNTRAVPSPDTVGVREALEFASMTLASVLRVAVDRAAGGRMLTPVGEAEAMCKLIQIAIPKIRAALSLSHCTAGRREEIVEAALKKADLGSWGTFTDGTPTPNLIAFADAILALSEQSGPTAGREEQVARIIATELGVTFDINEHPVAVGEVADREDCLRIAQCVLRAVPSPREAMQRCWDEISNAGCRQSLDDCHAGLVLAASMIARRMFRETGSRPVNVTPSPPDRQQDQK